MGYIKTHWLPIWLAKLVILFQLHPEEAAAAAAALAYLDADEAAAAELPEADAAAAAAALPAAAAAAAAADEESSRPWPWPPVDEHVKVSVKTMMHPVYCMYACSIISLLAVLATCLNTSASVVSQHIHEVLLQIASKLTCHCDYGSLIYRPPRILLSTWTLRYSKTQGCT